MKTNKKLQKKIQEWIKNNGACDIDIKNENIRLFNGGLFQDCNEEYAELWVGELNDTIRYLQRLKYFLNNNGFKTDESALDYYKKRPKEKENE